jgi:hypothetical protein
MNTPEINWSKYSDASIDFILSQSEKTMNETFLSYRENANKSYAALAIYSGILSYCVTKIIDGESQQSFMYFLLLSIGMGLSIFFIFGNLKPKRMTFVGSCKSLLCQEHFEDHVSKDEQSLEYKKLMIDTYDEGIQENIIQINRQIDCFKNSVYVFLTRMSATFLLFLVNR